MVWSPNIQSSIGNQIFCMIHLIYRSIQLCWQLQSIANSLSQHIQHCTRVWLGKTILCSCNFSWHICGPNFPLNLSAVLFHPGIFMNRETTITLDEDYISRVEHKATDWYRRWSLRAWIFRFASNDLKKAYFNGPFAWMIEILTAPRRLNQSFQKRLDCSIRVRPFTY